MKNELHILIEELQKEHDYLENELKACIEEWNFEGAEAFKGPLSYTREQLHILKKLDNPDYDKIIRLKSEIERLKKYEATDAYSIFATHRREYRIIECEKELSDLENKERPFHCDGDELIICLEKMIHEEIREFELEIENEGIVFDISKVDTNLKIEIRQVDKCALGYTATTNDLTELKRMGFLVAEKSAVKEIEDFEEKKVLPTIELLSRIAYETFRLYGNIKGKIKLKKS
jgi:hypothetical protein